MAVPTVYVRLPGLVAVRNVGKRSTSPVPAAVPAIVPRVTVPSVTAHPPAIAQVYLVPSLSSKYPPSFSSIVVLPPAVRELPPDNRAGTNDPDAGTPGSASFMPYVVSAGPPSPPSSSSPTNQFPPDRVSGSPPPVQCEAYQPLVREEKYRFVRHRLPSSKSSVKRPASGPSPT